MLNHEINSMRSSHRIGHNVNFCNMGIDAMNKNTELNQVQKELLASGLVYSLRHKIKSRYEIEKEILHHGEWLREMVNHYMRIEK